ncbi:MAG TPA: hypothetical protein VF013_00520 [Candidatus Limnocylindria bacterium]
MATRDREAPPPALTAYLLEGLDDQPLAEELATWLGERRFRAFVHSNREKIRKKLRTAADAEGRRDVRLELLAARLLLADRRMELTFEPYGARGGPDFRVSIAGQAPFNLEVTRLRARADETRVGAQLLAKLRQLPPSVANAVLIGVEGMTPDSVDLDAIVRGIRARADAKEETFFVGRGFESSRGFYQRFLRLGGAVIFNEMASGTGHARLWANPSARIPLPSQVARVAAELARHR